MVHRIAVLSRLIIASGLLALIGAFVLYVPQATQAQCGSQASSCKSCHEVQGQDAVNQDGTGWHESHAFGDFCQFCHGGNVQSMVKEEAHAGMVPPLADVQASCGNCHPSDLMEKAQVYASVLGVEVGTSSGVSVGSGTAPSGGEGESTAPSAQEAPPPAMIVQGEEVIDYSQRYEEAVLGKKPINWGNVVVSLMIVAVVIGGGSFVFWNERRLRRMSQRETALRGEEKVSEALPQELSAYPTEVVALLPQIAKLSPRGQKALKQILADPEAASELLYGLSQIDADLLHRVRNLDETARALLLALAGS